MRRSHQVRRSPRSRLRLGWQGVDVWTTIAAKGGERHERGSDSFRCDARGNVCRTREGGQKVLDLAIQCERMGPSVVGDHLFGALFAHAADRFAGLLPQLMHPD